VTPGQPSAISGPSAPPPTTLIPCTDAAHCASETVHFGTSATSVLVRWSSGRTTLALAPSFSVGGGVDQASMALLPLVTQPRFDVALEYRLTRRDILATEGNATAADSTPRTCDPTTGGPPPISDPNNPRLQQPSAGLAEVPECTPREQWAGAREIWRHRLTRRALLELSGGAIVARATINADTISTNPARAYNSVVYPTVSALFGYSLVNSDPDRPALHPIVTDPPKPIVYVVSRVGPVVDTHYGIIDPRFEVSGGVLAPLGPAYTFGAHAAFVRSIPPTSLDATYIAGSAELLRRIDKYRFDAGGGLRAAYQRDPFTGEFFVIMAYITLVWHEPRIKL
jgi:hypothetical protein